MLEHVPEWLGASLRSVRAGAEQLAVVNAALGRASPAIDLSSPAFADGARLPPRFTADGEGVSPPLVWGGVPERTQSLALIVEDADAPTPAPLVHAIVWGLPADAGRIAEGAIAAHSHPGGSAVGRNSFLAQGWLPPDPPTGHGDHRYVFQLFALDCACEDLGDTPGRAAVLDAMAGHIIGAGVLTGVYARGSTASVEQGQGAVATA